MSRTDRQRALKDSTAEFALPDVVLSVSFLAVLAVAGHRLAPETFAVGGVVLIAGALCRPLVEQIGRHRIILACQEELPAVCAAAVAAMQLWAGGFFLLQTGLAGLLWMHGVAPGFCLLCTLMGLEFLLLPGTALRRALAERAGAARRLRRLSIGRGIFGNVLAAAGLLLAPGLAALLLPRLVSALALRLMLGRVTPVAPSRGVGRRVGAMLRPEAGALGPLFETMRRYGDKLVVGMLMGAGTMGAYMLAAAVGILLARIVGQPAACLVSRGRIPETARAALVATGVASLAIGSLVLCLPWIVPHLLERELWMSADMSRSLVPLVGIFCLSGIPEFFWRGATARMRSEDQHQYEGMMNLGMALALVANTVLLAPYGIVAVAEGYLAVTVLIQFAGGSVLFAPALVAPKSGIR